MFTLESSRNPADVARGPEAPGAAAGQDQEDHEAGRGREGVDFRICIFCILYFCILYFCILYFCILYFCILYFVFSTKPSIKMISAEAPVLFAKAAEMFIHELTMRAWIHTEVTNTICRGGKYDLLW